MKRMTLTTIPLLCAAFAPLCADAQNDKCEAEKAKCMKKACEAPCVPPARWTDAEMNHITPSADPYVGCSWVVPYATADFIYWKVKEDGLDYAFSGTADAFTAESVESRGKVSNPRFSYEPGFKLGIGGKFRHDGWDFFAQYTWLRTNQEHHRGSTSSNIQSNIEMPRNGQNITFLAESAKAKWSTHFNILDLELGRNFWISKHLTLRPFIGMKFDWTRQNFNVNYDDVDTGAVFDLDILPGSDVSIHQKQSQWAVGIRTGLNTAWYIWKCLAIYGDIAISGMLNDFDTKRTDRVENTIDVEWTQNRMRSDRNPVTAIIEWALGLRWERSFSDDKYLMQLGAGWEQQVWFNQNHFIFMPNSQPADMDMQGLTIKAALYF